MKLLRRHRKSAQWSRQTRDQAIAKQARRSLRKEAMTPPSSVATLAHSLAQAEALRQSVSKQAFEGRLVGAVVGGLR